MELEKCDKALQIKIIFCWIIISFICGFISQHNGRLKHKHHLYKILVKIIFQISTMIVWQFSMHETWIGIENCQTITIFCVQHNMHSPQKLDIKYYFKLHLLHTTFNFFPLIIITTMVKLQKFNAKLFSPHYLGVKVVSHLVQC
jgi:hypothetical protein